MTLGPVGNLLSDPNKWTQERDCGTSNNRTCTVNNPTAIYWSLRAALELKYPIDWKDKLGIFMTEANKHYPGMPYDRLHQSLTHQTLMYLLKKTGL